MIFEKVPSSNNNSFLRKGETIFENFKLIRIEEIIICEDPVQFLVSKIQFVMSS